MPLGSTGSRVSSRSPAQSGCREGSTAGLIPLALGLFLCAVSCAEELPGTVPPDDQLHFPVGMELVEYGDETFLIVASTNFDQRFNAGRLFSFSAEALAQLAQPAADGSPTFIDNFGGAIRSSVRVDSFAGEVRSIRLRDGRPYVVSPSRQRTELTVVRVEPDGQLFCTTPGSDRKVGFDCTDSHRIALVARDPFPVVSTPQFGTGDQIIATGSLTSEILDGVNFEGILSVTSGAYIEARIAGQIGAFEALNDCNVRNVRVQGLRGAVGFIPLVSQTEGTAEFMTLSFRSGPPLSLWRHEVTTSTSNPTQNCRTETLETRTRLIDELSISAAEEVRFDAAVAAIEARGIVATSTQGRPEDRRAYVTVRFAETVDTSNSAVVIVRIGVESSTVAPLRELGEELGPPFLTERDDGTRLLYIGDQRTDQIFVVDVTTDVPRVAARIESRGIRDFGDKAVQARLLDQPATIKFYKERGGDQRSLAFVTNFSNSTLAVMDVSDPDPRRHRVVARLGRDLDPQGETEEP